MTPPACTPGAAEHCRTARTSARDCSCACEGRNHGAVWRRGEGLIHGIPGGRFAMADAEEVRPGDIWADNDTRSAGRLLRVAAVGGRYAECVVIQDAPHVRRSAKGRRTRIRLDRMRPTPRGYRLVRRGSDTP